jgi:small-conductance mechanosensitive channel
MDLTEIEKTLTDVWSDIVARFWNVGAAIELGAIAIALAVATILGRRLRAYLGTLTGERWHVDLLARLRDGLASTSIVAVWALLLWVLKGIADAGGLDNRLLVIFASLTTAWVFIRLVVQFIASRWWRTTFALIAWLIAALNVTGYLDETTALLRGVSFGIGSVQLSALGVVKGAILVVVLLWAVLTISSLTERRLSKVSGLSQSAMVLFSKLFRLVLFTLVFLIGLDTLGVDLSTLAIFGSAVGVGIGFGLQKIVANFISGLIILFDKSIKPGDVITVGETYGWIDRLQARYASVRTRDGLEILIPNELFITERVINWSHSDRLVRLRIPVGVSYMADIDKARALCLEAAVEVSRIHDEPAPICLIKGFGNSSVDLELRVWIHDPEGGQANVTSEVYERVWRKFHENDVEIPFPQRDLHIRSPEAIRVITESAEPPKRD